MEYDWESLLTCAMDHGLSNDVQEMSKVWKERKMRKLELSSRGHGKEQGADHQKVKLV